MRSKSTNAAILPGKKLDRGLSQLSSDRTNQSVNNVHTRTRLRPRRRPYKKRKRDLQRKNSQEKKETIFPRRQQPAAASCGDIYFFFCASPLVLLGLGLGSPEFFSISVAADAGARAWCVSLSRRSCLPILFLSCFSPLSPSILCLVYWCMGTGRWR